ncbi:MAG: hypothetical protein MI867_06070, partial [Pseudomonadales bacterium]|nr:hypothetical protein [Pseudomonadales bacterium]
MINRVFKSTLRQSVAKGKSNLLRVLFIGAVALGLPALVFGSGLPKPVERELVRLKIPTSAVSLYVRRVVASKPLLSVNAERSRNPASIS